jgi:hypothetical protein
MGRLGESAPGSAMAEKPCFSSGQGIATTLATAESFGSSDAVGDFRQRDYRRGGATGESRESAAFDMAARIHFNLQRTQTIKWARP